MKVAAVYLRASLYKWLIENGVRSDATEFDFGK